MFCTRLSVFVIMVLFLADSLFALEQPERKRFKHEKHGGIVFAEGNGYAIKCDIYQPVSDTPRPVMLAIHGGAWTTGTKFTMLRHARILANRGYVVMSIDYRLAPGHKWPAQIHDCKQAVRWIREHAANYNADPDRVFAFGYSAGGHLATMLATTDEDDGLEGPVKEPYAKHSTRIQGVIAGGAPTEFSWIDDDAVTLKHWLGKTKSADPVVYAKASPTTFITQDDPVMVLFHGTSDALVPVSSPTTFVESCKASGVDAELLLRNGGHAAVFTFTTNFIDSLEMFESLVAKDNCKSRIELVVRLVDSFIKAKGNMPESVDQLGRFVAAKSELTRDAFEKLMLNARDGRPFEIRWSSEAGVVVSEAVGVNGEKLTSRN